MFYEERRTELFWQFFYVFAGALVIGLSLAVALFPVVLIFNYPVPWLIPLLSLTALGGYGCMWFTKMFYRLYWKERHLSRYEVDETHVKGITYRIEAGESAKQLFPLEDIKQVVFFPAIVRKTQPSPTMRGGRRTIEFCPMLVIMTEEDSMEILFDQRDLTSFEQWMTYFHEHGVPLFYTPKQLYWIGSGMSTRRERFERLQRPEEIIPFAYTGNLVTDEQTAAGLWVETHGSERLNEGPHQAYIAKQRKVMVWTAVGTLGGIVFLAASMLGIAALT